MSTSSTIAPNSSETDTMPPTPSLTLILAATPSLGIGKAGGLPWPMLKKEMAYFARVTKRVATSSTADSTAADAGTTAGAAPRRRVNAVLMGRKTWESIPPKFRPLKDRLNVVLTRRAEEFAKDLVTETKSSASADTVEGPLVCTGIIDALSKLQDSSSLPSNTDIDRVFVIGGASIYTTALELPATKRVLLTKIRQEYECDTFFPLNLEESAGWRRCSREETGEFTGEEIGEEGVEEQGVRFEFCLFEKRE